MHRNRQHLHQVDVFQKDVFLDCSRRFVGVGTWTWVCYRFRESLYQIVVGCFACFSEHLPGRSAAGNDRDLVILNIGEVGGFLAVEVFRNRCQFKLQADLSINYR
jgi:hypothetical protein